MHGRATETPEESSLASMRDRCLRLSHADAVRMRIGVINDVVEGVLI